MTGLIGSFGNAQPAQATRLKQPPSPFFWLSHSKVEMVSLLPTLGQLGASERTDGIEGEGPL